MVILFEEKPRTEAPVNGGRNYRWTTVVVKSGYMLGSPEYPDLLALKIKKGSSNNDSGADNQQERPRCILAECKRRGILRDYTPDSQVCEMI